VNYKVLFLIPLFEYTDERTSKSKIAYPHTGIAYLASMLKKNDIPFEILDMNLGYSKSYILEYTNIYKPDMICLTTYSHNHKRLYELIDFIKPHYNGKTVIGGPHVSIIEKEALGKSSADFAVMGEGEFTLLELIRNLCESEDFGDIKGLIWRKNNEVIVNEKRDYIQDLDSLPFPAYEDFELEKYICNVDRRLPIITSRGCPYQCSFCCTRLSMGSRFRKRSPDNVIDEIEHWYKKGWLIFDINDDIFSLDRDRAIKICDMILERGLNIQFNFYAGLRVDTVDEKLLETFRAAGCSFITYGCESGNDRVLGVIKKGITVKDVVTAVNITRKVGINYKVNFIIGHPTETYGEAMDSIRLAKSLKCDVVGVYSLIPYPGTEVYTWIRKNKSARLCYPPDVYLNELTVGRPNIIFETDEFPAEERKKALIKGLEFERRTLAQFRFGKHKGYLVYLLSRNKHVSRISHKLLDTLLEREIGSKIYGKFVKPTWNPPKNRLIK
jgi:radical SAM superfamily enzyme YgiQ (UPF0313 family)